MKNKKWICDVQKLIVVFLLCGVGSLAFAKASLYALQSEWKNQNDKVVHLKDFTGQKIILGMVYTGCPNTCPLTVVRIQKLLKDSKSKKVKVVLASFDTKGDRPDVLKEFMKNRKLNEDQWTMMTAEKDATVRELAVVLGINYKELEDGEFSHSNVLTLLSKDGVIMETLEGLQSNPDKFIKAINAQDE